jgi:hypothetical protein
VPAEKLRLTRPQDNDYSEGDGNPCGWAGRDSFIAFMGEATGMPEEPLRAEAEVFVPLAGHDDDATFDFLVAEEKQARLQPCEMKCWRQYAGGIDPEDPFSGDYEGHEMPEDHVRCRGECQWRIFFPSLGTSQLCRRRCSNSERYLGTGCCDFAPCICKREHVLRVQPPIQVWKRWATPEHAAAEWKQQGNRAGVAGYALDGLD